MTLTYVLVFIFAAVLLGFLRAGRGREVAFLSASVLAIYALQPALPVRGLDFYLPTATLFLTVLIWVLTTPRQARAWRANLWALALMAGVVVLLAFTRFLDLPLALTPSRPPPLERTFLILVGAALLLFIVAWRTVPGRLALGAAVALLLFLFVVLKVPFLSLQVSLLLRALNEQSLATASPLDLRWLGFSYIAFRLLHTVRDRQSGRLPVASLAEFVIYVLFFPALPAGPIDRLERFLGDLRRPFLRSVEDWGEGGRRLLVGMFKKFALADTLALVALNEVNAAQVRGAVWAWIVLYAYAFQIYLDFSGYTDIAIGLGRLMGFRLPENFNAPYGKPNLTQFWNNWHMTLTQWFRAYFFNPLTRALRLARRPLPVPLIIFLTQLSTMVLIGLWHGVTWNFVLWGVWHGIGLFVHNRWSEWIRPQAVALAPRWQALLQVGGVLLTFHYVALGWVFFVLPEPALVWRFMQVLIGGS